MKLQAKARLLAGSIKKAMGGVMISATKTEGEDGSTIVIKSLFDHEVQETLNALLAQDKGTSSQDLPAMLQQREVLVKQLKTTVDSYVELTASAYHELGVKQEPKPKQQDRF